MVLTITEAVSIMVPETTMEDSETKTVAIRTTREIRITKTEDSETRTAADSEIKAAVLRIPREARVHKITVDSETKTAAAVSEILKAVQDQSLPAADSETVRVVPKALVQADNRAAEAALDKTIINNKTNS